MDLAERIAVVTGGGSGMGEAVSHRLAAAGASIAVWDINAGSAVAVAEAVEAAGGSATGYDVDVSSCDAVREQTAAVVAELGAPSILVNCAGAAHQDEFLDLSVDDWRRLLAVNLDGPFYTMSEIGRVMAENPAGGAIVNVSSQAGLQGFARRSAYVAAKTGLLGLTRAAAIDLAQFNIRVNAIAPGTIETPMLRKSWEASGGSAEQSAARSLLGRVGSASDIAELAYFLVSDAAGYITGQVVACDGGSSVNGNPGATIRA
jgi:2-hydroxycyclohexanecarboxyl-CoA dehydrogenase